MEKYGVPINVYGKEIVFRPMEIGGHYGTKKAEALEEYLNVEKAETGKEEVLVSREKRKAFIKFAVALLEQNYGDKAQEIAESLPIPVMASVFSIAWSGKEDVNFTEDGDQNDGSPLVVQEP